MVHLGVISVSKALDLKMPNLALVVIGWVLVAGLGGVECSVTGVIDVGGMGSGMGVMGAAGVEVGGLMVAIEGGRVG